MWKTMPRHRLKLTTDSDAGREDSGNKVGKTMVCELTDKNENEMSVVLVGTDGTVSFVSVLVQPQQNRRRFLSALGSGVREVFGTLCATVKLRDTEIAVRRVIKLDRYLNIGGRKYGKETESAHSCKVVCYLFHVFQAGVLWCRTTARTSIPSYHSLVGFGHRRDEHENPSARHRTGHSQSCSRTIATDCRSHARNHIIMSNTALVQLR